MRLLRKMKLCFILVVAASLLATVDAKRKKSVRRAQSNDEPTCRIVLATEQILNKQGFVTQVNDDWRCIRYGHSVNGLSYKIDPGRTKVDRDGRTFVRLTRPDFRVDSDGVATVEYSRITVVDEPDDFEDDDAAYGATPAKYREGSPDVLVARVSSRDSKFSVSATKLRRSVFARNSNSLYSQTRACSDTLLELVPAEVENIEGVMDVFIDVDVEDEDRTVVENIITEEAQAILGREGMALSDFGFVIYCLPEGTKGDWASESYTNYPRALLNDGNCTDVKFLMNALGANVGLERSLDNAGMMGPTVADKQDFAPRMCYDPFNSFKLGWYDDGMRTINPFKGKGEGVRLTGIDDYLAGNTFSNTYTTLVKIESKSQSSNEPLFVGFNRETGVNRDTLENGDTITVARRVPNDDSDGGATTTVVMTIAALQGNQLLRVSDFGGSGEDLYVEVCDIVIGRVPFYARVLFYTDDGTNRETIDCSDVDYVTRGTQEIATFRGSSSSSSSSNTALRPCEDDNTKTIRFGGSTSNRKCSDLRRSSRNRNSLRRDWCGENDVNEVCLATCKDYGAECTDSSDSDSVIEGVSVITQRGADSGGGSSGLSTQQGEDVVDEPELCEDNRGTFKISGVNMTCNSFRRMYRANKTTMRDLCQDSIAGRECEYTCRDWNSCD